MFSILCFFAICISVCVTAKVSQDIVIVAGNDRKNTAFETVTPSMVATHFFMSDADVIKLKNTLNATMSEEDARKVAEYTGKFSRNETEIQKRHKGFVSISFEIIVIIFFKHKYFYFIAGWSNDVGNHSKHKI